MRTDRALGYERAVGKSRGAIRTYLQRYTQGLTQSHVWSVEGFLGVACTDRGAGSLGAVGFVHAVAIATASVAVTAARAALNMMERDGVRVRARMSGLRREEGDR